MLCGCTLVNRSFCLAGCPHVPSCSTYIPVHNKTWQINKLYKLIYFPLALIASMVPFNASCKKSHFVCSSNMLLMVALIKFKDMWHQECHSQACHRDERERIEDWLIVMLSDSFESQTACLSYDPKNRGSLIWYLFTTEFISNHMIFIKLIVPLCFISKIGYAMLGYTLSLPKEVNSYTWDWVW